MNQRTCVICGFDRAIQTAHLANNRDTRRGKKRKRFEPTINLCANHHWLYDHHELIETEIMMLPIAFQGYYNAPSNVHRVFILSRAIKTIKKAIKKVEPIPRIRERKHRVNGEIYRYYYYCRGTDKEIYLGTAEAILKAVKRLQVG